MAIRVVAEKCRVHWDKRRADIVLESDAPPERALDELTSKNAYQMALEHARTLGLNASSQYGLPVGPYPTTADGRAVDAVTDEHGNFLGYNNASSTLRYRIDIVVQGQ